MLELPIRRVSFWLRLLNSVTFRPTGFLLSASFFFLFVFFISFCVPLFSAFMWRGYGFQLVDRATVVSVNKNKQKIGRTMPNTESIIRWKRDDERVSIVNLRALSVCTRARALPLPWNQRDFLVSLSLSLLVVSCVSCFSARCRNKEHTSLQSPISSNPFCSTILRWNLSRDEMLIWR